MDASGEITFHISYQLQWNWQNMVIMLNMVIKIGIQKVLFEEKEYQRQSNVNHTLRVHKIVDV